MWSDPVLWLRYRHRLATRKARVAAAEAAFETALGAIGPGASVVDCGANIGDITARLAATGATVHAFEPDRDAFATLSQRFSGTPNVRLYQAAVGVAAGKASLYASTRRTAGSTDHSVSSSLLTESHRVAKTPFDEVSVIDFPAFLETLPTAPRLVKIDIEGAEVALLERLFETGQIGSLGHVFVETHEKQMPSLRARTFRLIDRARAMPERPVCLDWG